MHHTKLTTKSWILVLTIFSIIKIHAQLGFCSGNSGDPIFIEDFGTAPSSATQHNPLASGTTTYRFLGNPPMIFADGLYTVTNLNYQQWNWFNTGDHTPEDSNGMMLVVNADNPGEVFYSLPATGLCENTTYEFSAWVMNLTPRDSPDGPPGATLMPCNVSFEIWDSTDTVLLESGSTNDFFGGTEAGGPEWIQRGLVFQTQPGQTSVILKMVNNGNSGYGNDIAIDDIEFKTCGDSITVENSSSSNSVCSTAVPYSTTLTAVPDNTVFSTHFYQWQGSIDGSTWTDISGQTSNTLAVSGVNTTTYYRAKIAEDAANVNISTCNTVSDVFVVTVNPQETPTFTNVAPICSGDAIPALPTTSNNGISGSWSPALDNTTTTTYTFTPDADECATTGALIITVNPQETPTFTNVAPICSGDTLAALPTTSNNGITGAWSPALDNTTTTTYTFTPDAGQCAETGALIITVNPQETPTFTNVTPICSGDALAALPTTSNNGITGTWSPALDNTTTTTYTFTPDAGQCAETGALIITVNQPDVPIFSNIPPICLGDMIPPLPTTSANGISGSWSPALDNTTTTEYTFTPDAGQCATTRELTITINQPDTPIFSNPDPICRGGMLSPLPTTSNNGISGSWSPALDNTTTTEYTFTPSPSECATTQTLIITVNPLVTAMFTDVPPICSGEPLSPLPTTSNNGITGTWSPALDNTTTTEYTFTPDPGFCPDPVFLTIEVFPKPESNIENESFYVCIDDQGAFIEASLLDTGLSTPRYTFEWFWNNIPILGANQGSYSTREPGTYQVLVTDTTIFDPSILPCSQQFEVLVMPLSPPIVRATVTTDAFVDNQTIEVSVDGTGDYQYKLDDGEWTEDPIFRNVSFGEHEVFAIDTRGCIPSSTTVFVIGYPKFFTPNNDQFNNTWNIKAPTNYLVTAKINIFDRYGKLLKEFFPSRESWDGTYNGDLLPTGDYWFVLQYFEPRVSATKTFRSHFTLKR